MANNAKTFSAAVDSTAAGTFYIWKCPPDANGGGVTIHEVWYAANGTVTGALLTYTDAGTPAVNGTIVASVAGTFAAGVPAVKTVADSWVDGDEWVVWAHTAGTALATSRIVFTYSEGR